MLPRYIEAMRPQTKLLLLDEQQRPGVQSPNHEAAEENRGGAGARDAERQHRQERRGAGGVRRRFRREHAVDAALAEALLVAGEALGEVVAHERGGDRPTGRDAEPASDGRGAQQGHPVARQGLPGLPDDPGADLGDVPAESKALLHGQKDLADAEEADHGDEEVDAAQQIGRAEGHAQLARDRVHADAGRAGGRAPSRSRSCGAARDPGRRRSRRSGDRRRRTPAARSAARSRRCGGRGR